MLPIAIIVKFDEKDYSGPSFCANIPKCVPVYTLTTCSNNGHEYGTNLVRQQFPLKLAWTITIYKTHGLTLNDIWVDSGPSEKAAGLTCVALTRVLSLSNLIIEPMPYERLTSL